MLIFIELDLIFLKDPDILAPILVTVVVTTLRQEFSYGSNAPLYCLKQVPSPNCFVFKFILHYLNLFKKAAFNVPLLCLHIAKQ